MLPKIPDLSAKKPDLETSNQVNEKPEVPVSHSPRRLHILICAIVACFLFTATVVPAAFLLTPRPLTVQALNITQASGVVVDVSIAADNSSLYTFSLEFNLLVKNPNYFDVYWSYASLNTSFPTPDVTPSPHLGDSVVITSLRFPSGQTTTSTIPFSITYDLSTANMTDSRAYMELLYACGLYDSELSHPLVVDWNLTVSSSWLSFKGNDAFNGALSTPCPVDKRILMRLPVPAGIAVPIPTDPASNSYGDFAGK